MQIPTNVPMVRLDRNDFIFTTRKEKYAAVVDDIVERHEKGQPVLVGTVSVEVSELLSTLLERRGVPHNVLNAKQHEREAEIIKDAGQKSAVTIATNMAGRGVDIKLGEGVPELGGLYVLGTERHESRRIDNQLRGRSGRQGDAGESRFYLSAEDDLIRLFAGDRMYRVLNRLGPGEGEALEHRMLSGVVERAQKKVEELNFMRRKNVLKYDEVMNEQRRVIYEQRRPHPRGRRLRRPGPRDGRSRSSRAPSRSPWPTPSTPKTGTSTRCSSPCAPSTTRRSPRSTSRPLTAADEVAELAVDDALAQYDEREKLIGEEQMRAVERAVMLQVVDVRWKDHLLDMDYLQEGIHLRALGQRDPLAEYKTEGFELFEDMLDGVRQSVVTTLMKNSPEDLAVLRRHDLRPADAGDELLERRRPRLRRRRSPAPRWRPARSPRPAATAATARRPPPRARRPWRRSRRSAQAPRRRAAAPRRAEGRPQRPLLVRQRQEVQEVPRRLRASPAPCNAVAARLRRACARFTALRLAAPSIRDLAADVRGRGGGASGVYCLAMTTVPEALEQLDSLRERLHGASERLSWLRSYL